MVAETASRIPAATTPNTPKPCRAIDAPIVIVVRKAVVRPTACSGSPASGRRVANHNPEPRASAPATPRTNNQNLPGFAQMRRADLHKVMHRADDPARDAASFLRTPSLSRGTLRDSFLFVNRFSCVCFAGAVRSRVRAGARGAHRRRQRAVRSRRGIHRSCTAGGGFCTATTPGYSGAARSVSGRHKASALGSSRRGSPGATGAGFRPRPPPRRGWQRCAGIPRRHFWR
jgi:hypothetical protein